MWEKCSALQDYVVSLRRGLHAIPELGIHLPKTQGFIAAELDRLDISYKKNQGDSGIIGEIKGGRPGKTVLLRADIDALPLTEDTGLPFSSQHENCMHACGHDAHAAMLLGALRVFQENREDLPGTVRFLFQSGEEVLRGAQIAMDEGVLDGIDAVFGCHIGSILSPDYPAGTVIATPGCAMASVDHFILRITGTGCHGSTPEKGVDPISIACNTVLSLHEVLAREIAAPQPAVLTVGKIAGGFAFNVIPSEVVIEGTTRTFDSDTRKYLAKRIAEVSAGVAATFRGSCVCELDLDAGLPPVMNEPAMSALVAQAAAKVVGQDQVITSVPSPNMGGEDFARFLEKKPGAFFFLSSANPAKCTTVPHHNPKFDIDEDVLHQGSAIFVSLTEDFLKQ